MTEAVAEAKTGAPASDWIVRCYEAAPLSPLQLGAVLAALLAACSISVRWSVGRLSPEWFATDILNGVVFAVVPTALAMLRRGVLRDLAALQPWLKAGPDDFEALARRTVGVPAPALFVSGLVLALFFGSIPVFDPSFWGPEGRPAPADPEFVFSTVRSVVAGWPVGHAVATELWVTREYYGLGARRLRVDLHDVDALAPFARRGMRSALAWILCVSLVSLFWLSPAAGSNNGVIVAVTLVLVGVQAIAGVAGARASVHTAKADRLRAIDALIRDEGERALRSGSDGAADARLANLVAYRGYVAGVAEWPLAAQSLVRFALLALLGIGSWLGGAVVDRIVDAALG